MGAERASAQGLLARFLHLALSQGALFLGRALLFLSFGLVLSPDAYGAVAILLSAGYVTTQLTDFGLTTLLLREGARDAERATQAIGGVLLCRIAISVPVLGAYLVVVAQLLGERTERATMVAFGVYALTYQVAQTAFALLRGLRRTHAEAAGTLAIQLGELAALALWHFGDDHGPLRLAIALSVVRSLGAITLLWLVRARSTARWSVAVAGRFMREHRAALLPLSMLALAQVLYTQSDVFILKALRDADEVGRYWACTRLAMVCFLPAGLLIQAGLPRLAGAQGSDREHQVFSGLHGLGAIWALVVLAAVLVHESTVIDLLLGPKLRDVNGLLGIVFFAYGLAYLPPFGIGLSVEPRPWHLVVASLVAALANLLANLMLTPKLGATGAATSAIISYGVMKLVLGFYFQRRKLPIFPVRSATITCLGLAAWYAMSRLLLEPITSLLVLGVGSLLALALRYPQARREIEGLQAPPTQR
jgi:O-antigen/teichoic acid export membrane protein